MKPELLERFNAAKWNEWLANLHVGERLLAPAIHAIHDQVVHALLHLLLLQVAFGFAQGGFLLDALVVVLLFVVLETVLADDIGATLLAVDELAVAGCSEVLAAVALELLLCVQNAALRRGRVALGGGPEQVVGRLLFM